MLCWERWHVHKCIMHFGNISFPNWCIKEPGWVGCGSAPWTASSLVFIRSLFWVSNYVMVWNKLWKGMSRYIKTASKWRSSKLFLIRWLLHFIATRIMIVELISGIKQWTEEKKKFVCKRVGLICSKLFGLGIFGCNLLLKCMFSMLSIDTSQHQIQ